MTPFQRHLKEALYLNENVPEIKPIQSDPDGPSGIDVFTPGGRETVAPPGGGQFDPNVLPGQMLPGGPPYFWETPNKDGGFDILIWNEETQQWELFEPAIENETEEEDGPGRDQGVERDRSPGRTRWEQAMDRWEEYFDVWMDDALLEWFQNGEYGEDMEGNPIETLEEWLEFMHDLYREASPMPMLYDYDPTYDLRTR